MPDINLNSFQKHIQTFMNHIKSTGETQVDEKTFLDKITNDRSIFCMLDQNCDGKITEDEMQTVLQADANNDGIVTENEMNCMKQLKFSARRTVDKWFSLDVNRDGHWSNIETKLGDKRMFENAASDTSLDASMSNEQLAELYNMKESIDDPNSKQLEKWLNGWLEDLKQEAKDQFGIELSNKQIIILKNEYKKQLNTWLFKTGDNATENAPLYNSLNLTAYTRLATSEQTVSCCGGDIIPPPAAPNKEGCVPVFNSLEYSEEYLIEIEKERDELEAKLDAKIKSGEITEEEATKEIEEFDNSKKLKNKADEVKNRLAWAMFKTPPKEELALDEDAVTVWQNMSDEQYNNYHQQYQQMRDMKASDFRELLKPENADKRAEFENNSAMTVQQIVDYIDIVEQQIGVGNFDKDDWSINAEQFNNIVIGVNGTAGDESRLEGKSRADIPENRQALLKFLEEKGWLYDQFK